MGTGGFAVLPAGKCSYASCPSCYLGNFLNRLRCIAFEIFEDIFLNRCTSFEIFKIFFGYGVSLLRCLKIFGDFLLNTSCNFRHGTPLSCTHRGVEQRNYALDYLDRILRDSKSSKFNKHSKKLSANENKGGEAAIKRCTRKF